MNKQAQFPSMPILRCLSARRAEAVVRASTVRRFTKGATLFRQSARADAAWIVLEGWVHLVRSEAGPNGAHPIVVFTVTPADALCGISAVGTGAYAASGIAGTQTRALRIPAPVFLDTLLHEPRFAYELVRLCAGRIHRMAEQYGVMMEPVSQRILRAILRLHEQFGPTIPVTHRELAQMSWTTTESAIRAVRLLKRSGCLEGTRGQLRVSSPDALRKALNGSMKPSGCHGVETASRDGVHAGAR